MGFFDDPIETINNATGGSLPSFGDSSPKGIWENTKGSSDTFVNNTNGSIHEAEKNTVSAIQQANKIANDAALHAIQTTSGAVSGASNFLNQNGLMPNYVNDAVNTGSNDTARFATDTSNSGTRAFNDTSNSGVKAAVDTESSATNAARSVNLAKTWGKWQAGASAYGEHLADISHNIQDNPIGAWHDGADFVGTRMVGGTFVKPVVDAWSRMTGGSGDGLNEMGASKHDSQEVSKGQAETVDAAKAAAGVVLAVPTGGASLLMTADVGSKYSGGSGDFLKDSGANKEISLGAHIAASVVNGFGANTALDGMGNIAAGAGAGAAQSATYANSTPDSIATGAATGAVTGGLKDGMGNVVDGTDNYSKAINAGARGAVGSGAVSLASGKTPEQALKDAAAGGVSAAGSSLLANSLDVGQAQGSHRLQHFNPDGTPDTSLSPQLFAVQTLTGGFRGGTYALANNTAFSEGARAGMIGGAAGSAAQQGAQTAGYGDIGQTVAQKVGETGGLLQAMPAAKVGDPSTLPGYMNSIPATAQPITYVPAAKLGKFTSGGSIDMANYESPAVTAAKARMKAKYR